MTTPAIKVAVITPHYRTPWPWLEQCLASVARQTHPCEHFLVCDGDEFPQAKQFPAVQVIKLPRPHGGCGDAARAIGAISAVAQGFDAIAFLDADNWYKPDHIQALVDLHLKTNAAFCSSSRNLYTPDGELLGPCFEVDGERFVDTNCMFFTARAFGFLAYWFHMPCELSKAGAGDRWVWAKLCASNIMRARHSRATVNYRTRYAVHYRRYNKPAPPDAKESIHITIR